MNMKYGEKMAKYVRDNLLFLVLVTQPLLDILAYFQGGDSTSVAGYIRLAYTVLIPLYTLIMLKDKKKFFFIMCIIAGACVLHIANGLRVGYIDLFADVKYMLLVVHMPVLLFSFMYLYKKESLFEQITKALKIIAIIILLAFYVSFVFKSGKYTYADAEVGWTGWYLIPNAQSVIISSLFAFVTYYILHFFKKVFPIPMLVVLFMHLENGTRAAYYSVILVLLGFVAFYVFEYIVKKEGKFPFYNVIMLAVLLGATIFDYEYSPRAGVDEYAEYVREQEQLVLDEALEQEDIDERELYLQSINPLLIERFGEDRVLKAYGEEKTSYSLADMRLKKLIYGKLVWEDTDVITKFVGYEYPKMQYKDENFDLENDPQAILYYYGYIGVVLYICLIGYFFLRLIKQLVVSFKESLNLFNFSVLLTVMLQLGLAAYTGYLLRRPNVAIYFMVALLFIHCRTKELGKGKEA